MWRFFMNSLLLLAGIVFHPIIRADAGPATDDSVNSLDMLHKPAIIDGNR